MKQVSLNAIILSTVLIAGIETPTQAQAFLPVEARWEWQPPSLGLMYGSAGRFNNYVLHSRLDDSYDPPFGYGEYAEYGPWAYRRFAVQNCTLMRLAWQRRTVGRGPLASCY